MIDFHSHILPGMDDGSKSTDESRAMLQMLAAQGAELVAATPHFYADRESPERFLQRRAAAAQALRQVWTPELPPFRLGAEVHYYKGISHLASIRALCLENSTALLLEMPVCRWTDYMMQEVQYLAGAGEITVVIAHMERYRSLQRRDTVARLLENNVRIQCNAGYFVNRWTRGTALRQLARGEVHLLGSDCHNTGARAPQLGAACEWIQKKAGREALVRMAQCARQLLAPQ